jgi:hypothetical protein
MKNPIMKCSFSFINSVLMLKIKVDIVEMLVYLRKANSLVHGHIFLFFIRFLLFIFVQIFIKVFCSLIFVKHLFILISFFIYNFIFHFLSTLKFSIFHHDNDFSILIFHLFEIKIDLINCNYDFH